MKREDLKALLLEVGLSQADFARLIGVTSRAVTLWMNDERAIPGPAEAYARVFRLLPPNIRQTELARLKYQFSGATRSGDGDARV
jgi:DNA-binding transcriptional regulator YiaG